MINVDGIKKRILGNHHFGKPWSKSFKFLAINGETNRVLGTPILGNMSNENHKTSGELGDFMNLTIKSEIQPHPTSKSQESKGKKPTTKPAPPSHTRFRSARSQSADRRDPHSTGRRTVRCRCSWMRPRGSWTPPQQAAGGRHPGPLGHADSPPGLKPKGDPCHTKA